MDRPTLSPGRVARAVIIALTLFLMAWLLWAARDLLFILFFAILVAIFLDVFVDRLVGWGVPRILSVIAVVAALGGVLALFVLGLWPTVRDQLGVVAQDLPRAVEQAGEWVQRQYRSVTGAVGVPAADAEQELRSRITRQAGSLVGGALPVLNTALGALAGLLIVLIGGIYMAASPGLYRRGFERLLPPRHRTPVAAALDRTAGTLRKWMVGTLINMVLVAVLVWLGLWFLDVPAAIALAVIAGVLEFVPIFGPIIASFPAIAVALTVSPMTAVWVAVLYTAIQQLEGDVITPLVMRGAVRLPPALTLLFQSFMAIVFGFLGLLLAVPILAAGIVMVQALYVEPMEARGGGRIEPAGSDTG